MTPAQILNADMATLRRWALHGWRWWIDELRGLVPTQLAQRLGRDAGVVAVAGATGSFALAGEAPRHAPDKARAVAAALAVPAGNCLVRELRLPVLARADLDRMLAYDIDRLMPFPPGSALVAIELGARDGAGHQQVSVAAMPRGRAQALVAAAAAQGIQARRLGIGDAASLRFDFLPALRAGNGPVAAPPARRWWWAVALLFGINLLVLVARDVQSLRSLDELVTVHAGTAATANQLRARVIAEDAARRDWLARRAATDPLALLGDVTRALPDSAWVQRLGWDGAQLRLTGFKRDDADVVGALRQLPRFAQARAASSDVAARQAIGEPFDITAQSRVPVAAGAAGAPR